MSSLQTRTKNSTQNIFCCREGNTRTHMHTLTNMFSNDECTAMLHWNDTPHKTSFAVAKKTHVHTCTHSQTCLAMKNAQPCLIEKTHTQACTSSFSVILECAGRPAWIHKRAHTHIHAHTHMLWACCSAIRTTWLSGISTLTVVSWYWEAAHGGLFSTCEYTRMFYITFQLLQRHCQTEVPEHSMQCAQCSRRDHLSLLMLQCIMVHCTWLECRQRPSWTSCNAFYTHAQAHAHDTDEINQTNCSQELRKTQFSGSLSTRITERQTCIYDKSFLGWGAPLFRK